MGLFWDWLMGREAVAPARAISVATSNSALSATSLRSGRVTAIDCETTGLSWKSGDRIVSLAGIELVDGLPSGRGFSLVFNPGRPSAPGARRVHGLPDEYLALQQPFSLYAPKLREFIGSDRVVAHNAAFDIGFLNNEFSIVGHRPIVAEPICTMWLYRSRFSGSASLDNCCIKYNLDVRARDQYHGAPIDVSLTAALFQGLTDDRQPPFHMVLVEPMAPTNSVGKPEDYRRAVHPRRASSSRAGRPQQ